MSNTQLSERYEILSELGRGSFGVVYLARDRQLGRDVALKILHPALVMHPDTVRLFSQEAGVLAQLEHDNIVTVYDMGVSDDSRFIAMRVVQGRSLAQVLSDEGPQSPERVAQWFAQIAAGLDYAHAQGILHRDLKPSNLLWDEARDRILISDFGLARAVESSGGSSSDHKRQTMPGTVLYMAPEVVEGEKATRASDLYSLGCVLYELLRGETPFTGDSPMSVMFQHVQTSAPALELAGETGHALARQVAALLAKDPAQRPVSAQAAVSALRDGTLPDTAPPSVPPIATPAASPAVTSTSSQTHATGADSVRSSRRRPLLVGAALAAILLIAALAIVYLGPGSEAPSEEDAAIAAVSEAPAPTATPLSAESSPAVAVAEDSTPTSPPTGQVAAVAGSIDDAAPTADAASTETASAEATAPQATSVQAIAAAQVPADATATDVAPTETPTVDATATPVVDLQATRAVQATADAQATAVIEAAATSSAATAIARATSISAQATSDAQATAISAQATGDAQAAAAAAAAAATTTAQAQATLAAQATATAGAQETAAAQAIATSVAATTEARKAASDATATAAAQATAASVDATATVEAGIARSTATAVAVATDVSAAATRVAEAVATRVSATETAVALDAALTADARNAAATAAAATAVAESRRATAEALAADMTADANAVVTTQAAATRAAASAHATMTAEAQRAASSTATAAIAKTAAARTPPTRTPTPTRTRMPTPTRTRTPLPPTPSRTPTPRTVVSTSPAGMANWSISPVFPDEQAASETDQRYEWTANFTLPAGHAFELVFWRRDEDPFVSGLGYAGTTTETSDIVKWSDMEVAPDVYYWGVLLVKTDPYERVKYLGGGRSFELWNWRNTAKNPKLGTGN